MLDRATSCLKAGARDSLKCAQKISIPRSKRLLHSSFWSHGAGDIDIPPWAISMLPLPSDLPPLKSDSHLKSQMRHQLAGNNKIATPDPPFLDFLYPPKALAWVQKTSCQQWERWEARNARRLPDGFVQATRSFSSTSKAPSGEDKDSGKLEEKEKDAENDVEPSEQGPGGAYMPFAEYEHELEQLHKNRGRDGRRTEDAQDRRLIEAMVHDAVIKPTEEEFKARAEQGKESVQRDAHLDENADNEQDAFADSPGELAEAAPPADTTWKMPTDPVSAMRTLQALLTSTKIPRDERVSRAWALYSSLQEDDKLNTRLKNELIPWFATQNTEIADAHCISLYWSLSLNERSLPTYRAALAAFLTRNDLESASGLHKEALTNIPNALPVTLDLFKYAIRYRRLEFAMTVKNDRDEYYSTSGQANDDALFWLGVGEIEHLVPLAADLTKRVMLKRSRLAKRGMEETRGYTELTARIAGEAMKVAQSWGPTSPQRQQIRNDHLYAITEFVAQFGSDRLTTLQDFLRSSLEVLHRLHKTKINDAFEKVYHVLSYVYHKCRNLPGAQLPESILTPFLKEVTWRNYDRNSDDKGRHSVTTTRIINDWKKWHGRLNAAATIEQIRYYAHAGKPAKVQDWFEYLQQYPYEQQKKTFFFLIHVHSRRADLASAQRTFDELEQIAAGHQDQLELNCWNTLLHAYSRADDLDGALAAFKQLLEERIRPDGKTFHPIMEMYASRGDVEGVEGLLAQFDALSADTRSTHMLGSHMNALINANDLEKAQTVLRDALSVVKGGTGKILGSLTSPFNILLTAYALQRDVDGTMRTYAWMKNAKVHMNALTYSALMQALIHHRQTNAAKKILSTTMPKLGLRASAFHYGIVMAGYINQAMYEDALRVHTTMQRKNVRHTVDSRRIYLKAVALNEFKLMKQDPSKRAQARSAPLVEIIRQLESALAIRDGSEVAAKQPSFGYDISGRRRDIGEYFGHIIHIHGKQRCLDAVVELFRRYREASADAGQSSHPPPMRILAGLMRAIGESRNRGRVDELWKVAKEYADLLSASSPQPELLTSRKNKQAPPLSLVPGNEARDASVADDDASAEIGFSSSQAVSSPSQQLVSQKDAPVANSKPALGYRHILARPLNEYIRVLSKQNRIGDMVRTVAQVLEQGYVFDLTTWNMFIKSICSARPPLVLLAFTLTERFLIPQFPGWHKVYRPHRGAVATGFQHIRGRYLPPNKVMPQYHTMLTLASGILWLRRTEAARGSSMRASLGGEMAQLVGSVKEIAEQAPQTLDAVDRMPYVDDALQKRYLR